MLLFMWVKRDLKKNYNVLECLYTVSLQRCVYQHLLSDCDSMFVLLSNRLNNNKDTLY